MKPRDQQASVHKQNIGASGVGYCVDCLKKGDITTRMTTRLQRSKMLVACVAVEAISHPSLGSMVRRLVSTSARAPRVIRLGLPRSYNTRPKCGAASCEANPFTFAMRFHLAVFVSHLSNSSLKERLWSKSFAATSSR